MQELLAYPKSESGAFMQMVLGLLVNYWFIVLTGTLESVLNGDHEKYCRIHNEVQHVKMPSRFQVAVRNCACARTSAYLLCLTWLVCFYHAA